MATRKATKKKSVKKTAAKKAPAKKTASKKAASKALPVDGAGPASADLPLDAGADPSAGAAVS